eukprot:COSAG01_NODE_1409_length_10417_cov_4.920043_10_plen_69_part_00
MGCCCCVCAVHERKVPPKLTRKIRGYFSVLYSQHGTVFDEMNFMSALPQNLREELVSCTFYLRCILYI